MNRIVVDWGTSNFRAYRFDAAGALAEEHAAAAGILAAGEGGFEAVLRREIGHWLRPGAAVLLAGMITSRNGWVETPYVAVPARIEDLAAQAVAVTLADGATLRFLPGVCQREPTPDVMRGEEIQVFGAVGPAESATLVHPGTHCKWVRVERGAITAFRTFMTGETFGVLRRHSILGRLVPEGAEEAFQADAFAAGVRQALAPGASLLNDLFTVRSGALLGQFPAADILDRLSGVLIGHEVGAGLRLGWGEAPPILFGEPALTRRYELALRLAGRGARPGPERATVAGFERLGRLPAGGG